MSTYNISKSSLISLKAEILKKQEELAKAKVQNRIKRVQLKKPLEIKNKGVEQRSNNERSDENDDLLLKSKTSLEAKAKLYERLSRTSNFTEEETERNRRYLVRFDKKKKSRVSDLPPSDDEIDDVPKYRDSDDEEQHFSDEYEPARNPDEEWVEYTDCLGRTRKCMRKDLEFLKSKDADLRVALDKDEIVEDRPDHSERGVKEDDQYKLEDNLDESNELLSSDMRRELLRRQWEKEEDELRKKNDIHYQDILFNEARLHGVGYYGFSKDEEVRAKQQEALKNLRQETKQQQKRAEELRRLREKQLAVRAKAARNRKRARMGLPPEEDEPETSQQPEEASKDEEKEKEKAEELKKEQAKEAARKKHIRPWDIGKEGIREHYEYSQDEWNEKKRKERPKEFAPPKLYQRSFTSDVRSKSPEKEHDKRLYFSSKKKATAREEDEFSVDTSKPPPVVRKGNLNPYKCKEACDDAPKNVAEFKPTPIVNECEDFDEEQDQLLSDYQSVKNNEASPDLCNDDSKDSKRGVGVEIAPPPTFDYYGPSDVKKSKPSRSSISKPNLEDSISAGLKFLRHQAEKKNSSTKHPSEMFLL